MITPLSAHHRYTRSKEKATEYARHRQVVTSGLEYKACGETYDYYRERYGLGPEQLEAANAYLRTRTLPCILDDEIINIIVDRDC
jgi:hypothetical protein